MKIRMFYALPLAATLALPVVAQQTAPDNQQPAAMSSSSSADQSSSSATNAASDQNMSAHQPLQPETREGFWGHLNPFARKKYVQRQMSPIRNRVNELDELTADNAKSIKDVDARAQEGIRQASNKANEADQHAVAAGNTAQQANQTATQASNRLNQVEQVVGNLDQYQTASQTEIRFPAGHTTLGPKAKAALDDMATNLNGQKGYVIEVQGFSPSHGQAGIQSSQAMANAVVRYLVEEHNVPVYRIFVMGMGNAKVQTASTDDHEQQQCEGERSARAEPGRSQSVEEQPRPARIEWRVCLLQQRPSATTAGSTAVRHHTNPPTLLAPSPRARGFYVAEPSGSLVCNYGNSLLFPHAFARWSFADRRQRNCTRHSGIRSRTAGKHRRRAGSMGGVALANCRNSRPTRRVFRRQAKAVHHAAGSARNGIPQALLERIAAHSIWRDAHLCRDRARCRIARRISRRRPGESLQSHRHHRAVPSRTGVRQTPGRLRRWASGESLAAPAGRRRVSRRLGCGAAEAVGAYRQRLAGLSSGVSNFVSRFEWQLECGRSAARSADVVLAPLVRVGLSAEKYFEGRGAAPFSRDTTLVLHRNSQANEELLRSPGVFRYDSPHAHAWG